MFFEIILLTLLLVCSAFFSGAETVLFALTRHERYRFERSGRGSFRLVASLMRQPRRVLLTLMVGNITVNMFIFATSLAFFQRLAGADSVAAPLLGLISPVLVTLFGEILPKGTAIVMRTRLAPRIAPAVRLCQIALMPVTVVLNGLLIEPLTRLLVGGGKPHQDVTVEELRALVEMSEQRRIIDADENAMLNGVIQLHERKVRDVMVPRVDMIAFEVHDDPDELRRLLAERRLSKIPVYDMDVDHVVGLVYARDLFLEREAPLSELVKPVPFVPDVARLTQLLHHFRRTHTQLAVAVDEYGGVVGLVTVEDVAGQIVGELSAEDEGEVPLWERIDDRHYRISGRMNIRAWAEQFAVRQIDERVTTLGGLIVALLGRLPVAGDQVRLGNLLLTVELLQGRRVARVGVELAEKTGVRPTGQQAEVR